MQRYRQSNNLQFAGDFSAGAKRSARRSHIARIVAHSCRDIGARSVANRQSIIAVLSGTCLPISSMSS